MFGLFRAMARSGGAIAACLALLGLAFYGIAQMSVILVDDPARGFRILGVFLLFSVAFCFALKWILRRAIAQALRPVGAAKEATSQLRRGRAASSSTLTPGTRGRRRPTRA